MQDYLSACISHARTVYLQYASQFFSKLIKLYVFTFKKNAFKRFFLFRTYETIRVCIKYMSRYNFIYAHIGLKKFTK